MGCAHDNCSCLDTGFKFGDRSFCSELCSQAAEVPTETPTELCPCLHAGCENKGADR
jgi:hypothetical protein